MPPIERISVRGHDPLPLSIEEMEERMETTCIEVDPCFGSFCWQFVSQYTCGQECIVLCQPFMGCNPYCYE
jgi:hypothetical protein